MSKTIVQVMESTATGTLSMVATVSNILVKQGYKVIVAYSVRDETPENLSEFFSKGITLIELDMAGKSALTALIKLRALIKREGADLVHLHSSFAGFIGRFAAFLLPCKVIYSPHCISFMRQDISPSKRVVFTILEWLACIPSRNYLACSNSEKLAIKNAIPFARVGVLENAVEQPKTFPVKESSNSATIITVGQIRTQKNPELFAAIAAEFEDNANIEFVWIGDGNDQTQKNELLQAGVKVTGWKQREEVFSLIANASVFLTTSLWEGHPVAPIESMFLSTPVIAKRCAGNVDVVDDGITGIIFDNKSQAVKAIYACLDPAYSNKLVSAALDKASVQYGYARFATELLAIYDQHLLNQG